jgi:hypothetical protein
MIVSALTLSHSAAVNSVNAGKLINVNSLIKDIFPGTYQMKMQLAATSVLYTLERLHSRASPVRKFEDQTTFTTWWVRPLLPSDFYYSSSTTPTCSLYNPQQEPNAKIQEI